MVWSNDDARRHIAIRVLPILADDRKKKDIASLFWQVQNSNSPSKSTFAALVYSQTARVRLKLSINRGEVYKSEVPLPRQLPIPVCFVTRELC